jgi:hypothetical protein
MILTCSGLATCYCIVFAIIPDVQLHVLYDCEIDIFEACLALKQIFNVSDILIETTQNQIIAKMLAEYLSFFKKILLLKKQSYSRLNKKNLIKCDLEKNHKNVQNTYHFKILYFNRVIQINITYVMSMTVQKYD